MTTDTDAIGDYLAAHGGPFYELQLRLGMLREHALRAGHRALVFVGLAWGIPLISSILGGHAWGLAADRPFLLDPGVWARFFAAVALLILVERRVEIKLRSTLRQFVRAPILTPKAFEAAAAAVAAALRRRDSRVAEAICLMLAILLSLTTLFNAFSAASSTWAVQGPAGDKSLTLAGWWCVLVSSPIFWFLLLRGIWRHMVWALLLRALARLELRLVATHPDGKGGLAFIGQYPNAYATFVLAISCVVGAAIARQLLDGDVAATTFGYIIAGWLLIVFAFFALPLSAFAAPLAALKQQTLLACGAKATQFHRLAERKILGANVIAPDPEEAAGTADTGDPSKEYDTARKLSSWLISRAALVPVAAAAVLPLAAAGLTELPYKEIVSIVKKLLLL